MKSVRDLAVLLAICFSVNAVLAQTPKADPAEWAPGDAVFFMGCADTAELWGAVQKTSMYTLFQDSQAKTMYGPLTDLAAKFKQRLAAVVEVSAEQLESPFAGPAALFWSVPSGKTMSDASPALVISVGKREVMQKYYASAVKHMREAAANYESVSAGSFKIDVFTGKGDKADDQGKTRGPSDAAQEDEDEGDEGESMEDIVTNPEAFLDKMFSPESMPKELAMTLADDRVIVARTADEVKALLRDDKSKSLASNEDYRAALRMFKPLGSLRVLINLPRIFELSKSEDPEEAKRMGAMGVKSMGCIVGHGQVAGPSFDSKMEMVLLTKGEPTGLMKILTMKNGPVAPRDNVPNTAGLHVSWHIDPVSVLDEVEKMIRQFDPDAADQMRAGMESVPTQSGEVVNIRKDLIENLRAPLAFSLAFTKPYGAQSTRMLLSIGLRSREAIEKFISLMAPQGMLIPRDVRGTQVFDSPMGGISVAPATDALYIGNTPAVEAALQGGTADSLAGDANFKRAAQVVPAEAWMTVYFDTRKMVEAALGLSEHTDELNASGMNLANILAGRIADSFGAKGEVKADDVRKVLKYYAPAIMTLTTTAEGLKMTYVQLKPEAN